MKTKMAPPKVAIIWIVSFIMVFLVSSCVEQVTPPSTPQPQPSPQQAQPGSPLTPAPAPIPTSTPATTPVTPAPATPTPAPAPTPTLMPATTPVTPIPATPSPLPTTPTPAALLEDTAYINSAVGFSIRSPRGWSKDASGADDTLVTFGNSQIDSDGGKQFVANINIVTDSMSGNDFDSYIKLNKQLLPQAVPGAIITGDRSVTLGSGAGRLLEWTGSKDGINLKVLTLFAPSQWEQQSAFVVTFVTLQSTWSKYQEVAQAALVSFRTTAPPPVVQFSGKLPPLTRVTYNTPEGKTVTVPALSGWVSLVAALGVTGDQVKKTADSAGASVIEADAQFGLYTLSVAGGKEGALIARLRQEPWVVDASPAFLVDVDQQGEKPVTLVDKSFDPNDPDNKYDPRNPSTKPNICRDYHYNLTEAQIASLGQKTSLVDARRKDSAQGEENLPKEIEFVSFLWHFYTGEKIKEAMNTGSVVNVSMGPAKKFTYKVRDRIGETELEYKLIDAEYKQARGAWLAMVFRTAEQGPDVPVVISAGNGDALNQGQDLTKYVEALRKQFPNAARRVRLTEAWWTNPQTGVWERAPWGDYSNVGSIAAPGVQVLMDTNGIRGLPSIGSVPCSGSSFAAPVVTGLMAGMRKASPDYKSAGELWVRFEKVTQRNIGPAWDKAALPRRLASEVTGRGVATLEVSPASLSIEVGKNQVLQARAKEANGTLIDTIPATAFTWSSANPAVGTVDKSGFVDGRSLGTTTVTVSIDGLAAKATVTVAAAASLSVSPFMVTPSGTFNVNGSGFTPSTQITVSVGNGVMTTTANAAGTFTLRSTAAFLSPGSYVVKAQDASGKQATASVMVTNPPCGGQAFAGTTWSGTAKPVGLPTLPFEFTFGTPTYYSTGCVVPVVSVRVNDPGRTWSLWTKPTLSSSPNRLECDGTTCKYFNLSFILTSGTFSYTVDGRTIVSSDYVIQMWNTQSITETSISGYAGAGSIAGGCCGNGSFTASRIK